MTTHHARQHPIILITGTPGTGKTLHSHLLEIETSDPDAPSSSSAPAGSGSGSGSGSSSSSSSPSSPMKHLNIGDIVKEHGFHEGWDEEWQSYIVDEDRLLDYLEEVVNPEEGPAATGFILDHHDPGLFPERWIDLAVVLTCDNSVLHDRLVERNYKPSKISENITAEIMMTCLSETKDSYAEEIVVELKSDGSGGEKEVQENVARIEAWIKQWREDRLAGRHDE